MDPQEQDSTNKDVEQTAPKTPLRGLAVWLLLIALFITMWQVFYQNQDKPDKIAFSPTFAQHVEEGEVRSCEIVVEVSGVQFIRGELTKMDSTTGRPKRFKCYVVGTGDVQQWLKEKGVQAEVVYQNPYVWQMLTGFHPVSSCSGPVVFPVRTADADCRARCDEFREKSCQVAQSSQEQDHF